MMSENEMMKDGALVAMIRSRTYAALAGAFRYPTPEFFAEIKTGAFAEELPTLVTAAYPDLDDEIAGALVTLCSANSLAEQQADYLRVFETGLPKPALALNEGLYANPAERAAILLELKAFLTRFGLVMNEEFREVEDSLMAELEFMQFLAAKEAQAIELDRDEQPYRRAQRDFLIRHLGRWVPRIAQDAAEIDSSFYRSIATIASNFVARDESALREAFAGSGDSAVQVADRSADRPMEKH
jgi:DMSO reductase family type II enzyme chaperone